MELKKSESCNCEYPEILKEHPDGCTLNQVIKCHGEQPLNELLKHIQVKKEEE